MGGSYSIDSRESCVGMSGSYSIDGRESCVGMGGSPILRPSYSGNP